VLPVPVEARVSVPTLAPVLALAQAVVLALALDMTFVLDLLLAVFPAPEVMTAVALTMMYIPVSVWAYRRYLLT